MHRHTTVDEGMLHTVCIWKPVSWLIKTWHGHQVADTLRDWQYTFSESLR